MVARYNPCGRVVDLGHQTGPARARLYPDSDEEFDILWYAALPDAPLLGCPTAVNRLIHERDREDWLPTDVGEVPFSFVDYQYLPPNPFALGIHRCGTASDFRGNGAINWNPPFVSYRFDGLPDCCGFAWEGLGGAVGGGSSPWWYYPPGDGGGVGGGSSPWWYFPAPLGGAVGGGGSPWAYLPPVEGGGVGGGSSPWAYLLPWVGDGGGVGGGSSPSGYGVPYEPSGGGVGGGSSPSGYGVPYEPSGGGVGGGSSEWWYLSLLIGDGGGVGGGSSEWWYLSLLIGDGGGVGGGSSEWSYTTSIVGDGGAVGGGEAEWSYTPPGGPYCDTYVVGVSTVLTRESPGSYNWSGDGLILSAVPGSAPGPTYWGLGVPTVPASYYQNESWNGVGTTTFALVTGPGTPTVSVRCGASPPP